MTVRTIPISEARKSLSRLAREVRKRPGLVYRLTVNGIIVAELRAPDAGATRLSGGEALLRALDDLPPREAPWPEGVASIAEEHDRFLYGAPSPTRRTSSRSSTATTAATATRGGSRPISPANGRTSSRPGKSSGKR